MAITTIEILDVMRAHDVVPDRFAEAVTARGRPR